ncbi:hypothetical protein L1987_29811 [Smallanthus sonchifolius]|uniref:Uncharacterized protein n=1 Tax=Smallanthus sonchifolius TaxID=185202 RepID=A0ACB9I0I5_9ASTR|nr:hypothetical protein L1987_29811 [Smallanthus sonchifolius]
MWWGVAGGGGGPAVGFSRNVEFTHTFTRLNPPSDDCGSRRRTGTKRIKLFEVPCGLLFSEDFSDDEKMAMGEGIMVFYHSLYL